MFTTVKPFTARYEIIGLIDGNWTSDLGDDYRTYASEKEAWEAVAALATVWAADGQDFDPADLSIRPVKE